MANTYVLIASNTLSSSTTSVTFSSIPGTYTDLVLKYSMRTDSNSYLQWLNMRFNGDSGSATTYSLTYLAASTSTSPVSGRYTSTYRWAVQGANAALSTSNTFSSYEVYIPSYTVSQNKPGSIFGVMENNSGTDNRWEIDTAAALYRNTSAITSIQIESGSNILSGSSFWLYGIKNS